MHLLKRHSRLNLLLTTTLISILLSACKGQVSKEKHTEDQKAKKMLQGSWMNEIEGNIVFTMKGDSIFYNDSLSSPSAFYVDNDTLFIENHTLVKYPIKHLNASSLCFINTEGDEVELTKSDGVTLGNGQYKGAISLNQGKKVKNDTVMTFNGIHYHAYTQVNPTTYKVYRETTNSDGLSVESTYYDNIVYIALYNGQQKIFGQNIEKKEFANLVPYSYLSQAILSEIDFGKVSDKGVTFIAILSIPDSYTNYRINILISPSGKKKLSL